MPTAGVFRQRPREVRVAGEGQRALVAAVAGQRLVAGDEQRQRVGAGEQRHLLRRTADGA